jgi:hypothetical protein
MRDTLNGDETIGRGKEIRAMTKVISRSSDEGGGCKQAHPEDVAALARGMRRLRI